MNVLLIGNLVEDRQESMQRFTALLHAGLQARGHRVTRLAPTLRLARLAPRYRYGGLPKYLGYFDKFVLFPRQLRRLIRSLRPDVVHITDHSNAVYGAATQGVPVLATCHDLLQVRAARGEIPRQKISRAGRHYQEWILASLARLPGVACASSQTRADVLRLTGLPPRQVAFIPNALNYPYEIIPAAAARLRLSALLARCHLEPALLDAARGGFLLHVGGGQWYKNRDGLIAIYARLRSRLSPAPRLVMVGPPLSAAQAVLSSQLGVGDQIVTLSGVTNPELEALYNLAEGLVFPSWDEGFGWPIAEAQACGCPVFTSDRAPMTEVGGPFPVYFDPGDPVGAAQVIMAAWPERNARSRAAHAESVRKNPGLMLDAYESLYRQIGR
jgi:glycosyltransferase involved in cell wall biosynthesis